MSTERGDGYVEALTEIRSTIRRRVNEPRVHEAGKLEFLDLLSMLDDMLNGGQPHKGFDDAAPEPLSGSF